MTNVDAPPPCYASSIKDIPPCYDHKKALNEFNALSGEEKAKLRKGMAMAANDKDATSQFKAAANKAAVAMANLDKMFDQLIARLLNFDKERFVEDSERIKVHFRNVVKKNRARWQSRPRCTRVRLIQSLSNSVRIRRSPWSDARSISQVSFKDGNNIKREAEAMENSFNSMKTEFGQFVGRFSTWAKGQEDNDNKKDQGLIHRNRRHVSGLVKRFSS